MRLSLAILFAASLVSGYVVQKRQACAATCASQGSWAPCQENDIACICLNPNYTGPLATCITSTCSQADATTASQASIAGCKAAGVDFTLNNGNPMPACAVHCDQLLTTCATTDIACQCKDTSYVTEWISCVRGSCQGQDLSTAILVVEAECRAYGADISSIVGA